MDGEGRNHQKVAVDVDQPLFDPFLPGQKLFQFRIQFRRKLRARGTVCHFREDTACRGEGPVKPGRHQHSAVALRIQPYIAVRAREFRILLDLEGR